MRLDQIVELVSRIPEGGVINSNDRWDMGYMHKLVGEYRARMCQLVYNTNKRLHPAWYQKHWPEYEPYLQDNDGCSVKFRHPEIVMLDDRSDGFRYIGGTDCASNFARIASRAWVSTFNDNRVTKVNANRRTSVLYDGSAEILEIYGDPEIEDILTESIVSNPMKIPTFNFGVDQYPVPENLVPEIVNMIFNDNISTELRMPYNGSGGINLPRPKKNK